MRYFWIEIWANIAAVVLISDSKELWYPISLLTICLAGLIYEMQKTYFAQRATNIEEQIAQARAELSREEFM